jgi:hypothetical protein
MSTRPGRGQDADIEQAPVTVSPAVGPLPAIYVPQPGEAGSAGLLWRATARSARRAGGWATRRLRPRRLPQPTKGACDER